MTDVNRGEPGTWRYLCSWRNGQIELGRTAGMLAASDQDAAMEIAAELPGQLHYAKATSTWYIWDGQCHRPDDSGHAERLVLSYGSRVLQAVSACRSAVLAELALQLDGATDAQRRDAFRQRWGPFEAPEKYHAGLKRSAGHAALLKMLGHVCGCGEKDLEDRWPYLLNCANGTVDLRTGQIRDHDPADMITYCLATRYVPGARGLEWEQLTLHVAGENPNVWRHLIKVLGYSLTGENPEQKIVFLSGPTASGKTVMLDVVQEVAGQLAHSSTGQLISLGKNERNARVENSIAGKRLVTITETAERMSIDEGQVKRLTGETRISRNRHYSAAEIETPVTWLIMVATNEMPTLTHIDAAMRRRVTVVPCGDTVPEAVRDKHKRARILALEREAVLASLVWGAMAYCAEGLEPPAEVAVFTDQYVEQQDTVEAWLDDSAMIVAPGGYLNGSSPRQGDTRKSYVVWCRENRVPVLGVQAFHRKLRSNPAAAWNQNRKRYDGIVLIRDPGRLIEDES